MHAGIEDAAVMFAVLRDQPDPVLDRLVGGVDLLLLTLDPCFPALLRHGPVNDAGQLGPA